MRVRGQKYWEWSKPELHFRDYDERLRDGTSINIQVRHSPNEGVQLFVGVYGAKGIMLFEEVYDSPPGETMTQAIEWGVDQAHKFIDKNKPKSRASSAKPEPLPRKGSGGSNKLRLQNS
ncbi:MULTISPECIES: hypothetical protein [unclassified Pseudomonas]|uniref:hypothetical protein n=1 Tax=unclassified Pseudomonas TaxID=196821 RepID=UPI0025EEB0C6|nr:MULTISPECIES: hypothetical protein [unclassified Pseudomonas]